MTQIKKKILELFFLLKLKTGIWYFFQNKGIDFQTFVKQFSRTHVLGVNFYKIVSLIWTQELAADIL